MKAITFAVLFVAAFLLGFAVNRLLPKQRAETVPETTVKKESDEQLIRKTEASYDSAWQQGDIEGLMHYFADDAVLISPRGDKAFGKQEIRELFTAFLGQEGKDTKHTSRIIRINFITPEVAIVDGEAFIQGTESLSAAVRHHYFVDILVRNGSTWHISQIRAFAS